MRDLAVLDPYNPRSVAFQVAALNEHIAALPSLKERRPDRAAAAARGRAAGELTTAEAAKLDARSLFALEQDLLNLADAIGLHYFPHGPNAQPAGEADGSRVIYDIRHVTTYSYESPVSFARCSLRLEPHERRRPATGLAHASRSRPRPAERTCGAISSARRPRAS